MTGEATRVMFSSETDMWETPRALFDLLSKEFRFATDVCALPGNAKCAHYFTPAMDGLSQTWTGICWMNPPYGRAIGAWVQKAYESARDGAVVVCLLPARTDTTWWHDYCMLGEVRLVRGRLRFGKASAGAPFPSAIVIFRPHRILQANGLEIPPDTKTRREYRIKRPHRVLPPNV